MTEEVTYRLDIYEGPLEVLLDMIQKKKIDIRDIPIAEICDQYLAYIEERQKFDMEIAGEFIIMASELIKIKTAMLLPHDPMNWEDPRKPLVNALELYQQAKEKVKELRPLYEQYSGRFTKDQDEVPPDKGLPHDLDPTILAKALSGMLLRIKNTPKPTTLVTPLIKSRIVPVEEKIDEVVNKLEKYGESSFFFLLKDAEDKPELIATFMGILELVKLGRILLCLDESDEDKEIELTVAFRINPDYVPPETPTESEFDRGAETDDNSGK